jgi:hypothetical protein
MSTWSKASLLLGNCPVVLYLRVGQVEWALYILHTHPPIGAKARHGGTHLQSQNLGGWDRKITSSRATQQDSVLIKQQQTNEKALKTLQVCVCWAVTKAVVELTIAFWDWSKREDDDPQWPACWKFWFSKGSLCYFLFIHAGNGTKAWVLTVTLRGHFTDKKTKVE